MSAVERGAGSSAMRAHSCRKSSPRNSSEGFNSSSQLCRTLWALNLMTASYCCVRSLPSRLTEGDTVHSGLSTGNPTWPSKGGFPIWFEQDVLRAGCDGLYLSAIHCFSGLLYGRWLKITSEAITAHSLDQGAQSNFLLVLIFCHKPKIIWDRKVDLILDLLSTMLLPKPLCLHLHLFTFIWDQDFQDSLPGDFNLDLVTYVILTF